MSLRSVPDGRAPVPMLWWLPIVTIAVLATTTTAVVAGWGGLSPWIAVAASIIGYALVWWRIRPAPLRTGPYTWLTTGGLSRDRTDPPTILIPASIRRRGGRPGRPAILLIVGAGMGLGFSFAWSVVIGLSLNPEAPEVSTARTAAGALLVAVINSAITSVLEECGMALLILAVAAAAQRYLPLRYDDRSVAVYAILTATLARTALHVPLWGVGAIGRLGLSFALAWLFWRTRRIWPLILTHLVWDSLALQTLVSPSPVVAFLSALVSLAWGITGTVVTIIAIVHSRQDIRCANHYYAHRHRPPG